MAAQLLMPCNHVSDCFPCNDLPSINHSAEGQDTIQDFSIQWGNLQTNTPPLGRLFRANGCMVLCVSSVSQEDAFLCAQRQQAVCTFNNWQQQPEDPPVCLNFPCTPTTPPVDPPVESFTNAPEACTTHCPDGVPFTFAVPGGSFVADNQTLANRMASSFACREAIIHQLCVTLASPFVCLDSSSTLSFVATGRFLSPTDNFWEIRSGSLPPGWSFTSGTGGPFFEISGVSTALGDYMFTIRVTAPNGDFAERTFTATVSGITTPDPLTDADLGSPYSVILTESGITGDLIWLITDGALPDGLTLNETTGEISGTATESGDFTFTVSVSSATQGCDKVFHLKVGGCFIDSPGAGFTQGVAYTLARNGAIAAISDSGVNGFYYLSRSFQANNGTLGSPPNDNGGCGGDRYVWGVDNFGGGNLYWLDVQTATIRNLGALTTFTCQMNDNGDMTITDSFSYSFIYNAGTNSFSANLFAADTYNPLDLNNSRASVGTIPVLGNAHTFIRSAGGVYTDVHPGLTQSSPQASSGGGYRAINSLGHICGAANTGGNFRVFANFGGASIFLSGVISGTRGGVFINESDQVAWVDNNTGHLFIYSGGVTTDHGAPASGISSLEGFTDAGVAVGSPIAGQNWIFDGTSFSNLISKIPSAAGDGWASLDVSIGINNQNFVAGYGTKSGNPNTLFVAKVCL